VPNLAAHRQCEYFRIERPWFDQVFAVQESLQRDGGKLSEEVARRAAAALVRRALELGSTDNATAVVLLPEWVERGPKPGSTNPQLGDTLYLQQPHLGHSLDKENLKESGPGRKLEKTPSRREEGPQQVEDVHRLMTDMTLRDSLALS
jgi:hypothetical protein